MISSSFKSSSKVNSSLSRIACTTHVCARCWNKMYKLCLPDNHQLLRNASRVGLPTVWCLPFHSVVNDLRSRARLDINTRNNYHGRGRRTSIGERGVKVVTLQNMEAGDVLSKLNTLENRDLVCNEAVLTVLSNR